MVLREDRELLAHLALVNSDVPGIAVRLMNGQLPVDEQRAFARRLVDIAEALIIHADRRDHPILEHQPPASAAIEGGCCSAASRSASTAL